MPHRAGPRRPVVLNRDHARPRTAAAPEDSAITARLSDLVDPATAVVLPDCRGFGLRDRKLSLPVMVSIVVTLIWRHVPSVAELARLVPREGKGLPPVSQQALSQRLRCFPAVLFLRVLDVLRPRLEERARDRHRPVPPILTRAMQHFAQIWVVDGTTLEPLFKKVGTLRGQPGAISGGTVEAVLDVLTKLPVALWFDPASHANDLRFRARIQACLRPTTLLLFDGGYTNFAFADWLTGHGHGWITRAKANLAFRVDHVWLHTATVRDRQVTYGLNRSNPAVYPARLIEVQVKDTWQRYLTNIPPEDLVAADIVDLYGRRWSIESVFLLTKRLLGMSYLWAGAVNAVVLQVWATWLLYAVLIDLTDAVAEELDQPLDRMSVEMIYRGLYHAAEARRQGDARDPVAYLADPANADLGVVKRVRKRTAHTAGDIIRMVQPLPDSTGDTPPVRQGPWYGLGVPGVGPLRPLKDDIVTPADDAVPRAQWPMAPRPDTLNL